MRRELTHSCAPFVQAGGASGVAAAIKFLATAKNVQEVAITGASSHLTEVFVPRAAGLRPYARFVPAELDIAQASASDYSQVFSACVAEPKCQSVTLWGVRDPVRPPPSSLPPSPPSSRTLTLLLSRCVLPVRATGLLARVRGPAPLRRQLRGEASVHRRREGSRMSAPGARARRSKIGVRRWAIGGCTRVRLRVRCVLQPVSRARVEV